MSDALRTYTYEELTQIRRDLQKENAELKKDAKLGKSVTKGVAEIMPHTACKGFYQSNHCRDVNNDKYGCVLKYYCDLQAEVNS